VFVKCLFSVAVALFLLAGLAASALPAPVPDPYGYWDFFNVYSLGNIGASNYFYTSDFQGVAGAAGDAYFEDFALNVAGGLQPFAISTGGDVYLRHGSFLDGGLEAGGDAHLDYFFVQGDVRTGGSVFAGALDPTDPLDGGTVLGSVYSQGGGYMNAFYVSGDVVVNASGTMTFGTTSGGHVNGWVDGVVDLSSAWTYSPMVDHGHVSRYFLDTCDTIGAMADQGATVDVMYGLDGRALITIDAVSGVNVVNLSAADWLAAWGVHVKGPQGAIVYVNVQGLVSGSFRDVVWWTSNGALLQDVVVNFPDATSILFDGYHGVSMLMPHADVEFADGLLVGTFVAGDLLGGGQVNLPGSYIPEPATLLLLCSGLGGVAAVGLRRQRAA